MQAKTTIHTNRKIGVLGGTFNPPHNGHLQIAKSAHDEFNLDEVWLLPLGLPPHKRDHRVATREQREEMTRLLADERDFLFLRTDELKRGGYTYTVDTLRVWNREKNAGDVFYYIIGSDTLFFLETWKDFREVLTYTEFLCVPRPGTDMHSVTEKIAQFREEYDKIIYLLKSPGPDISSTAVRNALFQGESIKGMVPESLRRYLEGNNVYRV